MRKKITTLLLAAMIVVSFALPTVNAADNNDCNNILNGLNTQTVKAMMQNIDCDTTDIDQLKETILSQPDVQVEENCTANDIMNILNENCDLVTDINLDELTPELLAELQINTCKNAEKTATSTSETTEVPPEASAAPVEEKNDNMNLTVPTIDATPEAQPIPTDTAMEIEPIPTEDADAAVEPMISTPPKAEVPETTPEPTPEPTVEVTPEPTAAPTAQPTSAPAANTANVSEIERKMVAMVNEDRAAAGLAPLTIDSDLTYYARLHSADMSQNNFFSHTSPTNGSFSERLRNADLNVMGGGENIAMYGSVEKAQAALMASDGHRANILGNFTHVGIGIVYNEAKGAYYITQWFGRK